MCFCFVQVTGFVGAERAGWELLIERMGAELCKSLSKRVTTHLVCKEVRERAELTVENCGIKMACSPRLDPEFSTPSTIAVIRVFMSTAKQSNHPHTHAPKHPRHFDF